MFVPCDRLALGTSAEFKYEVYFINRIAPYTSAEPGFKTSFSKSIKKNHEDVFLGLIV